MNTHELSLKTYQDLQKRKREREKKAESEADAVLFTNVAKVQKNRYRQYWTRGIK